MGQGQGEGTGTGWGNDTGGKDEQKRGAKEELRQGEID